VTRRFRRAAGASLVAASIAVSASTASAQSVPFLDTEDATLSGIDVGEGDVHPILSFDVRNGDYARGALDDDAAGLGRVPVHVAIGGAVVLRRDADGRGSMFVVGQSSNGFHAPSAEERVRPRAWYESNTIVGLAWRPVEGVTTAAAYAIKTSPNGIAATTHEASLSFLYSAKDAIGALAPRVAVTRRTKGNGGVYTILGIAPQFALGDGESAATLTLPATVGVGWQGFYAAGAGDRVYGSTGLTLAKPVRIGGASASVQAEVLALVRDDGLRRLDAPGGTTDTIVPLATVSVTMAW